MRYCKSKSGFQSTIKYFYTIKLVALSGGGGGGGDFLVGFF